METIIFALVMLLAVVVSGSLVRMSPVPIPIPLVQILLGALIGSIVDLRVDLNPDVFFLLFLPPLLFLDGWRIPKQGLLRDKGTILQLSFGLVAFTVLGIGIFIHWMIPAMPLAVAFALGAVISPTDPVAISAIAERIPMPKRLMHILEAESLLNDATGLVFLRLAVVVALTGAFSVSDAVSTFLRLVLGGILIGVAGTWGVVWLKNWLSRRYGEETSGQILISLLIPFAAYLAAEHLHCSGILGAVSAGITMSYAEISGQALAVTRVQRSAVWETVQFALNGVIFVLLGEQLPVIISGAAAVVRETNHSEPWWLAIYVIAINLALGSLRFVWVWTSLQFTLFRRSWQGQK